MTLPLCCAKCPVIVQLHVLRSPVQFPSKSWWQRTGDGRHPWLNFRQSRRRLDTFQLFQISTPNQAVLLRCIEYLFVELHEFPQKCNTRLQLIAFVAPDDDAELGRSDLSLPNRYSNFLMQEGWAMESWWFIGSQIRCCRCSAVHCVSELEFEVTKPVKIPLAI